MFPMKIDSSGKINVETGPTKAVSRSVASADQATKPPA
jgi:hypothetical protein